MKTNAILATCFLTFACVLGCDSDEGTSDPVLESVDEAETPIIEVDANYVEANADAEGLVSLDFGADAEAIYRVDLDVLDQVVLESESGSIAASEWLELTSTDTADADSIVLASPNAADSLESDEGFRAVIVCLCGGGVCVCVIVENQV